MLSRTAVRAVVRAAVRSRAPPALSSQYYICTTIQRISLSFPRRRTRRRTRRSPSSQSYTCTTIQPKSLSFPRRRTRRRTRRSPLSRPSGAVLPVLHLYYNSTFEIRAVVRAAVRSRAHRLCPPSTIHLYHKSTQILQLPINTRRHTRCSPLSRPSGSDYICTTIQRKSLSFPQSAPQSVIHSTKIMGLSLPVAFSYRFHPRFAFIPVSFSSPQAPPRFVFAPSRCDPRAMPVSSSRFASTPLGFRPAVVIPAPSPFRFHPALLIPHAIPLSFSPRGSDHQFRSHPRFVFHPRFAFTPSRHSRVSISRVLNLNENPTSEMLLGKITTPSLEHGCSNSSEMFGVQFRPFVKPLACPSRDGWYKAVKGGKWWKE